LDAVRFRSCLSGLRPDFQSERLLMRHTSSRLRPPTPRAITARAEGVRLFGPFLAFPFGLPPRGALALLRGEVRTGFQLVALTQV